MFNPENLLLIDIETVPASRHYDQLDKKLQLLWDKKSHLIDKENEITQNTFAEKAGIYAEFGKIICIGLGYFVKQNDAWSLRIKSLHGDDEKKLLEEFSGVCNKFFHKPEKQFCGHNIREFDIPYICRRSYINGVKLPDVLAELQNKKPWENPMLDTLQLWKFGEYKNFTSIDLLSAVLGIDSPKDDIDGSQVANVYWEQNDLNRIATYCSKDVVTVAQVLMRLNSMPLLTEEEIVYID